MKIDQYCLGALSVKLKKYNALPLQVERSDYALDNSYSKQLDKIKKFLT